jgi:hypothetical protein
MPTVFVKDGFRFFFYSNEHRPIHVHVRRGGGAAAGYLRFLRKFEIDHEERFILKGLNER